MFQFKKFSVQDDRCAMKVGTDGVLLGAWTKCGNENAHIIDVGAGCGLISLMLAQRYQRSRIIALEIDSAAAQQAMENVEHSPYSNQVSVVQGDFNSFSKVDESYCKLGENIFELFDVVVSNPPFYEEDILPPNVSRATARNTQSGLNYHNLIAKSFEILQDNGVLCVILPKASLSSFHSIANEFGFTLVHVLDVKTVQRKEPKRVLLKFSKEKIDYPVLRETITLIEDGIRSQAYSSLCQDFYL